MAVVGAALTQLLHLALMLAAAPLLIGLLGWFRARLTGRRGASPLQPFRDLGKLLRKRPLLTENASPMTTGAPYVAVGAAVAALALVPSFARGMLLAPVADLILLAGLLAIGRVAMALAAMDVGDAFGGMGAARAMSLSVLAEPALLLVALCIAALAGTTGIDAAAGVFQDAGLRAPLGLALLALVAVAAADNARNPVDDPAARQEPAMMREAMLLDASGRHLALWEYAASLRLLLWLTLLAALFFPFGLAAPGAGPVAWVAGLVAWAAKMAVLTLALAVSESATARMRLVRVPELLGAALLLGLLGAALLFLSARLA
jgi:formate hydrogenlyase subunit 4